MKLQKKRSLPNRTLLLLALLIFPVNLPGKSPRDCLKFKQRLAGVDVHVSPPLV